MISTLTDEEWRGPSAAAMATAATPYVGWMHTTAAAAQNAANQAVASAAAMYGYAGSSASAGKLYPLSDPASTTNPGGLAGRPPRSPRPPARRPDCPGWCPARPA